MKAPKKPVSKKPVSKKPVSKKPVSKKPAPAKAKKPVPPLSPREKPLRQFVLRTYSGRLVHSVNDLITANQLARALSVKIKVFKRTPEGEVLMSFNGPRTVGDANPQPEGYAVPEGQAPRKKPG